MIDLAHFTLLNVVAVGLAAVWLSAVRLRMGDGPDASGAVAVGTLTILVVAAFSCSLLLAIVHRAWLAAILSLATGWVLFAGASPLFSLLVPKGLGGDRGRRDGVSMGAIYFDRRNTSWPSVARLTLLGCPW